MTQLAMNTGQDSIHQRRYSQDFLMAGVSAALILVIWSVFGQSLRHDFVAYDDQNYVYANPAITAGINVRSLIYAFTQSHARNWHPITSISHMLDCEVFGLNPSGHHLVNVLLHTAAALLLFRILQNLTGSIWRSAFVAAVFAIHPLRVESVAWIAERKDVLSGVFFMLTLMSYVSYVRRPSSARYCSVVLVFALGLMSKPTLVITPVLLLLLDYWPLNRSANAENRQKIIVRCSIEKLPLLGLSVVSTVATLIVQKSTIAYTNQIPFAARLANASSSYLIYVGQTLWPFKLAPFYPYTTDHFSGAALIASVILIAITALALVKRHRAPYFIVGWCWYLICLLPMIGIVQAGLQSHADRYTYLAQIGLLVALTWSAVELLNRLSSRQTVCWSGAILVITLLGLRAHDQTGYWNNTESLWQHAVEACPENEVAQFNLAQLLVERGHFSKAIVHYEKALADRERSPTSSNHLSAGIIENALGTALADEKLFDDALVHYRRAVALQPDLADAHVNLGTMLLRTGDKIAAIEEYQKAVEIPPEDAANHLRLAVLLLQTGQRDLAQLHYRRALQLSPTVSRSQAALSAADTGKSH
jgi:protein O-mannosyl-transferase